MIVGDVLERKIEDLSRQLAEEKQCSRKEKLQVARLQREIARNKGTRDSNFGWKLLSGFSVSVQK
ncbi:hypothetical protein KUTeg_002022 [Tegillarca granosa]|uniref:Uncharacterized protein n=1 Tax=Tegillarca granosa TaxID=220873 RepID=A0ABQ9FT77_TEGGR|nr:hypothetical protein KUTeg_002022 [Tegillarca granosa]